MASGFFLGGLGEGIASGVDTVSRYKYTQGLLQLEQQRLQQSQQNQQRGEYMKLRSDLVSHIGETITQLKNAHPDWTDLQVASNPAVVGLKNSLSTFTKNLQLPDDSESIIAGFSAGKSQIETEAALARAKEGPLAAEEKKARIDYLRSGIPEGRPGSTAQNPDAPGLPGNDAALGTPGSRVSAGFEQLAQSTQSDVAGSPADDFLKTLPEDRRDNVLGVYSGQIPLNTFSTRTYRGQTKSQRQLVTEDVEKYGRLTGQPYDARQVKADTASLAKVQASADAIKTFEDTAIANGDVLVDLAKKVDKTGIPIVEAWTRAGRQATGDPNVAKFNTQMTLWRAEVAKILTNPNISGQLTDTARAEVERAIQPGASWQQIAATHELLKGDFARRSQALDATIYRIKNRNKSSGGTEGPGITVHGFTFTPTGQ